MPAPSAPAPVTDPFALARLCRTTHSTVTRMPSALLLFAVQPWIVVSVPVTLNPIPVEFVRLAAVEVLPKALQFVTVQPPPTLKPADVAALLVLDEAVQFMRLQLLPTKIPLVTVLLDAVQLKRELGPFALIPFVPVLFSTTQLFITDPAPTLIALALVPDREFSRAGQFVREQAATVKMPKPPVLLSTVQLISVQALPVPIATAPATEKVFERAVQLARVEPSEAEMPNELVLPDAVQLLREEPGPV